MFIKLNVSGIWWPATDCAQLTVHVFSEAFEVDPPLRRDFHRRQLEVLPNGGAPDLMLKPMAQFGIGQWRRLIDMSAPPF